MLSYIVAGTSEIKNLKISVTTQGGVTLYTLDLGAGQVAQPRFNSLAALIENYKVPGTGLPVPLGAYVSPPAARPAQTAMPVQQEPPPPAAAPAPAPAPGVVNVANDALVAPSHPTFVSPATKRKKKNKK